MGFEAIEAALSRGDMHGAAKLAAAMLTAGTRNAYLLNIAAWACEDQGDYDRALMLLAEAGQHDPTDPLIVLSVGAVKRKQGRLTEAFAAFASVATRLADNPAFWLERGYAHEMANRFAEAADDFAQAVALDPGSAVALAALAAMRSRLGLYDEARTAASRALACTPGQITASIALARCDLEEGNAAAARDRLTGVLVRTDVPLAEICMAFGLLGDACDRLGAHREAFSAYVSANQAYRQQHHRLVAPDGQEGQTDFIEQRLAALEAIDPSSWMAAGPTVHTPADGHCFLLGYPRSGTTLVETILASAPGVEALEERATLINAERSFLEPTDGLAKLAALDASLLAPYVDRYWAQVRYCGLEPEGRYFVDMDPLKGMKLPLIARLFPEARIILMRRDPRDVVLSCFRTSFAPSAAAWEFTTLESAARHYDALMRFTERCLERLPLRVQELRYDALVGNFDATTQNLCTFLGIAWNEDLRRFDRTAAQRSIATASAAQVRRGLYDGTRQWEAYADQLAEVEAILAPWVERFGFA